MKFVMEISSNIQKCETNCIKKLSGFVNKMNQCANSLTKSAAELKHIAAELTAKSQQLQQLENIKPENLRCYSVEQKDRVLLELFNQMNAQLITANKIIQELVCFHNILTVDYRNLLVSANSMATSTAENVLIKGTCKQRPLSFYLEDACRILHAWKHYQNALDVSLNQINIRDSNSVKLFERRTTLPQELNVYLERYLMFSAFLLSQK